VVRFLVAASSRYGEGLSFDFVTFGELPHPTVSTGKSGEAFRGQAFKIQQFRTFLIFAVGFIEEIDL